MNYAERGCGNAVNPRGPFLIVGASGFLGSEIYLQLVKLLSDKRHRGTPRILGLVRSDAPEDVNPRLKLHEHCPVELLRSTGPVVTLVELEGWLDSRCSGYIAGIFHVAGLALQSQEPDDVVLMKQANVDLTNVIFSFAAKHNIRTAYASCSGVVGCQFLEDWQRVGHDNSRHCEASIEPFPFLKQKAAIEERWQQEALKGRAPIIFLRPSMLYGPGDERLTSTLLLFHIMRGSLRTRSAGGISFVDVRDCAKAFVKVMLDGRSIEGGTTMNLTACNMPFDDFVQLVETTLRVRGPRLGLPPSLELGMAKLQSRLRRALKLDPHFGSNPCSVMFRQRFWNVTCQRAKELVDWDPTELEETILDTARFIHRTFIACPDGDPHAAVVSRRLSGGRSARRLDGYVMVLVVLVGLLVMVLVHDHFYLV